MGKSLFLSAEHIHDIQYSLDNLYIAKLMYDAGKPLPPDTVFYEQVFSLFDEGSIFFKALSILFDDKTVFDTVEGDIYEDGYISFKISIPEVKHFHQLTKALTNLEQKEKVDYIMSEIKRIYCDYIDLMLETELVDDGLKAKISGFEGMLNGFVDGFITFKNRLDEVISELQRSVVVGGSRAG